MSQKIYVKSAFGPNLPVREIINANHNRGTCGAVLEDGRRYETGFHYSDFVPMGATLAKMFYSQCGALRANDTSREQRKQKDQR